MTNQNKSDSCESHADFDYKYLRCVLVVNTHLYARGKNYSDNSIVGYRLLWINNEWTLLNYS